MEKNLTKEQVQVIVKNAPKSIPTEQIIKGLVDRGYALEGLSMPAPKPENDALNIYGGGNQGIANKLKEGVQSGAQDIQQGNIVKGITKSGLRTAGDVAGTIFAPVGVAVNKVTGGKLDQSFQEIQKNIEEGKGTVGQAVDYITNNPAVQEFAMKHPNAGEDFTRLLNILFAGGEKGKIEPSTVIERTGTQIDPIIKGPGNFGRKIEGSVAKVLENNSMIQKGKETMSNIFKTPEARKAIIQAQEESGIRPSLSDTIKQKTEIDPTFSETVKEAQKQGFGEKDVNLLASLSDADKPIIEKMYNATVKAQSDPRQITRAADILGENATKIVKQVESQNSAAGKLVDTTAKALKGQKVDATPLKKSITESLANAGIELSANGNLNFQNSIFKNVPKIQKELQRVLRSVPDGSDAYQLHIFKKSIDELINYGSQGEGISGRAKNLMQSFRSAADDLLDSNFHDYNVANTEYKLTREFLDGTKDVVGKNIDFSTKQGAQEFGQAFRSAFSNNKSRGATLKMIEDLQNIAKERKLKGAEQNLLDQALYVNILEDTFGSQAATGLASEVGKGVKKVKDFATAVRNPVQGAFNAAADAIEKAQNITPEAKKEILRKFSQLSK